MFPYHLDADGLQRVLDGREGSLSTVDIPLLILGTHTHSSSIFFLYLLYYTTSLLQTISTLIFYPIVHDLWSNIPVNMSSIYLPIL